MPYGCHGRPQWNSPPKYWNVIQCMWPSTIPPTFPKEVEERLGFPLAFNAASGDVAQRLAARTRRRRAAPSFPAVVRPFAGWAAFLNVKVPFRGAATTQTAAGASWLARPRGAR